MKIVAVIVNRANYGRIKPLLSELQRDKNVSLELVLAGSTVLYRFGSLIDDIISDGFCVRAEIFCEIEGGQKLTMAKSLGFAVMEFAGEFSREPIDRVLLIGDRYEALAAALAAGYLNLPIVHLQGGEVSGTLDEVARHCISKFANLHFPATIRSRDFLIRMGERADSVFCFGCPSMDVIAAAMNLSITHVAEEVNALGVGREIDFCKPVNLIMLHPTTAMAEKSVGIDSLVRVVSDMLPNSIWLWPNIDAGSDTISKGIRKSRECGMLNQVRFIKNLKPETFYKILSIANVALGNSSSFVRDTCSLGTPVVLLGDRQAGREFGDNVLLLNGTPKISDLKDAIVKQASAPNYPPKSLYGQPGCSKLIAEKLVAFNNIQSKKLSYINDTYSDT